MEDQDEVKLQKKTHGKITFIFSESFISASQPIPAMVGNGILEFWTHQLDLLPNLISWLGSAAKFPASSDQQMPKKWHLEDLFL